MTYVKDLRCVDKCTNTKTSYNSRINKLVNIETK